MKNTWSNLKREAASHNDAVRSLFISIEVLFIFAIGIGRYRTVLALVFIFLIRAFVKYKKKDDRPITALISPVLVVCVYYDFTVGQIVPVFDHFNWIFTIIVLLIIDEFFVRRFLYHSLQRWSQQTLFLVCPRCGFGNTQPAEKCPKCGFVNEGEPVLKGKRDEIKHEADGSIIEEINRYKEAKLYKQPSNRILASLELASDEFILINYRRPRLFCNYFKNDTAELIQYIILTTKRVIFLGFAPFSEGWFVREIINYADIRDASFEEDQEWTHLRLRTEGDLYYLRFSSLVEATSKVKAIVSCIDRRTVNIRSLTR